MRFKSLLGLGFPFFPVLYSVPTTVETIGSLSVSTTVHTWIGTWGKEEVEKEEVEEVEEEEVEEEKEEVEEVKLLLFFTCSSTCTQTSTGTSTHSSFGSK